MFKFCITKKLKNDIKRRSRELDISMSDYIRTLIKKDLTENKIVNNTMDHDKNLYDVNNFNKKLSGYYTRL